MKIAKKIQRLENWANKICDHIVHLGISEKLKENVHCELKLPEWDVKDLALIAINKVMFKWPLSYQKMCILHEMGHAFTDQKCCASEREYRAQIWAREKALSLKNNKAVEWADAIAEQWTKYNYNTDSAYMRRYIKAGRKYLTKIKK